MSATERTTMEKKPSMNPFPNAFPRLFRAVGAALMFALVLSAQAFGQGTTITGTVTSTGGAPLPGVTVRVQGTDARALTDASGKYRITAPADAVLTFSFVGQRPVQTTVAGRNVVDVTMAQVPYLEQVVVTAYTEQRRGEITGAVSSVNVEQVQKQTGASVLQRLDAAVPGVTVLNSGNPGSRSTVRIRGISSFQNNDPLYVIDGTPVQSDYLNFLNPDDITSVQVLKDASAASIYGSRASNGVILIETTKKGVSGPPAVTLRARTGVQSPVRGYDDFLITNALDYFQVVKAAYTNAGLAIPTNIYGDPNNPTVPQYIFAQDAATDAFGRPINVNLANYAYPNSLIMPGSAGTNWWKAVFRSAPVSDVNLDVNGGGQDNAYRVSFNYFDQNGTARYNRFQRGTVRANTSFNRGKFNVGENVALGLERSYGGVGNDDFGEGAFLGKNILLQPVIPIYDVGGNFASGKSTTLGNSSNPLGYAFNHRNDINRNITVFGNMFGGYDATTALSLKSRLGFNIGQNSFAGFNPATPENAEPNPFNSINENNNQFYDWTWSNTARYLKSFNRHSLDFLVGQEANANNNRFITASIANLLNPDINSRFIQDALADPKTKNVSSSGGKSALLSLFAKADYNFADKYVASATVRRDGSSRLGPGHRWGTFPAFGLGWHISNEPFLQGNRWLNDVMIRYGVGTTGNQLIPSGRIVSQFGGGRGETFYDISGTGSTVQPGYRQTSLGNPDLRWESQKSQNIGADMVLWNGNLNFVFDVYRRNTDNLLYDPALPATAGQSAPPIVNVGKMKNTGFDFSIGHTSTWWNATFNGSHYKNTIVSINGVQDFFYGPISTRFGNQVINQVGHPIGSFYGYIADGMFRDAADVAAHATQDGAAPGRIKFRDVNGDGVINLDDRAIIGSPNPKFTGSLDLGARYGNFDFSTTIFGTYGNDIFENQMEFYVFREFEANVRKDLLANSWTPTNLNAKYPRLDQNDTYSTALSSFYVKDGSYTRIRNVQVGYTLPGTSRYLPGARVYVQGDNLWTKTNYEGLDPSLPAANVFGAAGDLRDQYRGVDRGVYPTSRVFSIGIVTSF
jgi:TonB-dependent starch-binding outer membrane protein SusC